MKYRLTLDIELQGEINNVDIDMIRKIIDCIKASDKSIRYVHLEHLFAFLEERDYRNSITR